MKDYAAGAGKAWANAVKQGLTHKQNRREQQAKYELHGEPPLGFGVTSLLFGAGELPVGFGVASLQDSIASLQDSSRLRVRGAQAKNVANKPLTTSKRQCALLPRLSRIHPSIHHPWTCRGKFVRNFNQP